VVKVLQTSALPLGYVAIGNHYNDFPMPGQGWLAQPQESRHNTLYD
jgi:hypothetical protein